MRKFSRGCAYLDDLDLHVIVEVSGGTVKRIILSRKAPDVERSGTAARIADHIRGGPRPDLDLDLSWATDFQMAVYRAVLNIPRGSTATYSGIAKIAGRPGAARAVGAALRVNPFPVMIPCHRVVASNGPGGYSQGIDIKLQLLAIEQMSRNLIS
ncbi:methylated-DNA--[protein]-cysteine S-methyltransferase [Methanothrix sp.]|uniref:methylated-DNA--[protein]-cysteine S-methyltransferase n=1 Tax=Methanothrix sp. TaxID=90426 RepID=UPI003C7278AB